MINVGNGPLVWDLPPHATTEKNCPVLGAKNGVLGVRRGERGTLRKLFWRVGGS